MKKQKLVPLMPILVQKRACYGARDWVKTRNAATFREAYDSCPDFEYLDWLVCEFGLVSAADKATQDKWWKARTADAVREVFPAHIVERALYDYAVREGLA